jgi:hypothetical protein
MKAHWGNGGKVPRILIFGTRWRWVVNFTTQPLCPRRKNRRHPLDMGLGGSQSRSERDGDEKESHYCPCRQLSPNRPARSLVSILSELPWLSRTGWQGAANMKVAWDWIKWDNGEPYNLYYSPNILVWPQKGMCRLGKGKVVPVLLFF